jgi:hypothetical protein
MSHLSARCWSILLGTALVLWGLVTPGRATPLDKGQTVSLNGTTAAAMPELAGVVLSSRFASFEADWERPGG